MSFSDWWQHNVNDPLSDAWQKGVNDPLSDAWQKGVNAPLKAAAPYLLAIAGLVLVVALRK